MDLYYIDYLSVHSQSWLHRLPAWSKLIALLLIVAALISVEYVVLDVAVLLAMIIIISTAHIPLRLFFALTLYPVVFLVLLYLSIGELTLAAALLLATRVLAISSSVITVFLSTSYPAIFGTLQWVLPAFLVAALFYSYRSIFIIFDSFNDMHIALHLRGGLNWRHPLTALRTLGMALGHVLVHAIDISERTADGLTLRGFRNRVYYLGETDVR